MKQGREVDCLGMARSYGIKVKYRALPMTLGGLLYTGSKWTDLVLNKFHGEEEQRLTVAHELAHYLRGDCQTDRILFRSDADTLHEHQIEREGIAILTPIPAMQREWIAVQRIGSATPYAQTLAEIFVIPEPSMIARIAEMLAAGLIS